MKHMTQQFVTGGNAALALALLATPEPATVDTGRDSASLAPEGFPMCPGLPQKVIDQIDKAGLPIGGEHPFRPRLVTNRRGEQIIAKEAVQKGPKRGTYGYVDEQGQIWVKDRSHAQLPDHWDVQIDGGDDYLRVSLDGHEIRRCGAQSDVNDPA
jgi:hypothetical protein